MCVCGGPPELPVVTLARPEVRNAFNAELIAELTAALTELAQTPRLRMLVLTAEGETFCAGADFHWMRGQQSASTRGKPARRAQGIRPLPHAVQLSLSDDCAGAGERFWRRRGAGGLLRYRGDGRKRGAGVQRGANRTDPGDDLAVRDPQDRRGTRARIVFNGDAACRPARVWRSVLPAAWRGRTRWTTRW